MSRVVNRLANMNKTTRSSVFTYALVVGAFVILQLLRMTTGLGSGAGGAADPHLRLCDHGPGPEPGGGPCPESWSLGHAGLYELGAFLGCAAA